MGKNSDMKFVSLDADKEVWQVYSILTNTYVVYYRWTSGGWTFSSARPSQSRNMLPNRVLEHKRDIFIAERLKWEDLWN